MDFQQIQQLVTLVEHSQIQEIDLHDSDRQQRIRIKNALAENTLIPDQIDQTASQTSGQAFSQTLNQPTSQSVSQADNVITSTQVGWLQLAPDAGSANQVSVGDSVTVGDVVAWVSVMDRLLPIESKKAGTISKILVENNQAIQYGMALFELA